MGRFVVLLRGVNVGKGPRVPMAGLRELLTALGHGEVQTLLNSGNAVFSSRAREPARLAEAIAQAVEQAFGVTTPVIVKSAAQFDTIVRESPIAPPESAHSHCLVAFSMAPEALQALAVLQPLVQPGERWVITDHAAYLHCPGGLLQSRIGEALLGRAGRALTTRNWATTRKLHALLTPAT